MPDLDQERLTNLYIHLETHREIAESVKCPYNCPDYYGRFIIHLTRVRSGQSLGFISSVCRWLWGGVLTQRTLSKPWLVELSWDELLTLCACLGLDLIEYLIPVMMAPIYGDFLDLVGIILCGVFFRWLGFISLIELIPGLDALPNFTVTWLVWYIYKKRGEKARLEDELERWR